MTKKQYYEQLKQSYLLILKKHNDKKDLCKRIEDKIKDINNKLKRN